MYSCIFFAEIMQVLCFINSKKQWLILLKVVMGFASQRVEGKRFENASTFIIILSSSLCINHH